MQEDVGFGADKRYDFVGFRLVRELDLGALDYGLS